MKTPTRRHLFVAGFMGTGKSAVGAHLARRLQLCHYDLDGVVAEITGHSIPTIFKTEGEAAFRSYEARALRMLVSGSPAVISLGGGAPTVASIANMLRHTGRTVVLTASWDVVWQRLAEGGERPLLGDVLEQSGNGGKDAEQFERFVARAESIMKSRERIYRDIADWTIDTSELTVEQAADRILDLMEAPVR